MKKKNVIILIILLITLITIILTIKPIRENVKTIFQKEEKIQRIEYEIYSNENNMLRYLITVTDTENGIQEIIYPNGDKMICNGKTKVGVDYVIQENGTYQFIAKTTTGEEIREEIVVDDDYRANRVIPVERLYEISTERNYRVDYNYKNIEFDCWYTIGENNQNWINAENGIIINVDGYDAYHKDLVNEYGTVTLKLKKVDKFGNTVEIKYTEDYNIREDFYHMEDQILEGESIIACIRDNKEIKSVNYILRVNGEEYPAEIYNYDEDVNYITNKNLGTIENDQRMVIMKYNKNLNVRENDNIITTQARKKGMFIYVEEELINSGEISMSGKGANAVGQDVYLLKNENGTYEYVPARGGDGGASVSARIKGVGTKSVSSNAGKNGQSRQTGGGASGDVYIHSVGSEWSTVIATSGSGSTGTSYSGGVGGESCSVGVIGYDYVDKKGEDGQINGGKLAGGLVIIKTNILNNKERITANALSERSGGGSINIFCDELVQRGTIETKGESNGGDGCVSLGNTSIQAPRLTIDEITKTSFRINIEDTNPEISEKTYDYYINGELKIGNTKSLTETISLLNLGTKYTIYVVEKIEDYKIASKEVTVYTEGLIREDLPNYIGTNLEYPIMTKDGMKNVKYTNLDDETDYIYGLDLNTRCRAEDALDKAAYDEDESTYFDPSTGKNKFYFGDNIDIYKVCFKIDNDYSGRVYTGISVEGYIRVGEGVLSNGVFHTTFYGKGSDAWKGVFTQLTTKTYEIYYDENLD